MYSGSDSTESQKYPQWALNPSAYQNMANDQVDWAALAQQWIIMKEAGPPPIPGESPIVLNNKQAKEPVTEGGEAPMDVENDKDDSPGWSTSGGPPQGSGEPWNWNAQNQNWNWNNWTPASGAPPPGVMKPPLLPTPGNFNQFSAPPESTSDNAVPFGGGYSTAAPAAPPPSNEYSTGYWTSSGGGNSTKQIKPHNRRYSKVNVPRPVPPAAPVISDIPISVSPPMLDAAKRKQLPAWIREGLEKMERDKLKQLEKEREKQERDEYNEKVKQNEKEKMEILKTTMKEQQKSKFESDNDYSDNEVQEKKRKSPEPPVPLTPDELMLKVRRTMTEILLTVTNRHIETICKEELERYKKKYKASDRRSSAPSGANISAKLGLGIYGGGSGSSSEESDDDGEDYQKDKQDSDSELKETIKRKLNDFSKTEREIEDKLAEAESKKIGHGSRSSTPDTNDNDSQVDARLQGRKPRSMDRTPPHRNIHAKSKKRSPSSSSSTSENYLSVRAKLCKRSSSSESDESRKKSKRKRHISRSYSRTPERKYNKTHLDKAVRSKKTKSKSPRRRRSRSDSRGRRDSTSSRSRNSKRSRSRSYSRSRRSRSGSYRRSKEKSRNRSRDRSSRYSKSRKSRSRSDSRKSRKRRSRSSSSGRGKRSHRY